jgi:hypothetical protein
MGTRGEFKTGGNNRRLQFPGVIHAMSAISPSWRAEISNVFKQSINLQEFHL